MTRWDSSFIWYIPVTPGFGRGSTPIEITKTRTIAVSRDARSIPCRTTTLINAFQLNRFCAPEPSFDRRPVEEIMGHGYGMVGVEDERGYREPAQARPLERDPLIRGIIPVVRKEEMRMGSGIP